MNCEVKKQTDERSLYFDILRCVSMFAVVGVHVCGSLLPSAGGVNPILSSIIEHFNSLGVFFFFAISGYFALKNKFDNIKSYYKKRFVRIIIPYFVYAVIYTVYFTGIEQNNFLGVLWGKDSYVARILTANVHGTHWFVYAILFFYLCVPYLDRLIKALSKKEIEILYYGSFLVLVICCILSEVRARWGINNGLNVDYVIWMLKIFLMFTTGYIVNDVLHYRLGLIPKIILVVLAFAGYCCNFAFMDYFMLFIIMQESKGAGQKGIFSKIIQHLAFQSYSIYLVHAAVLSFLLKVLAYLNIPIWGKVIGMYILVVFVSDLVSLGIDWLCTRRVINLTKKFIQI